VSAPVILALMSFCFLFFGYLGVPVPFSLMAGVFVGALLADVSLAAIMQKIFDGVDSEALLAIPFFLLVGELMSSANVVVRIANLSLSLVGHIRGGLSQVVVVFSMFFGIAVAAIGKKGQPILDVLDSTAQAMFKFTGYVMAFAPVGVFAAIAATVGGKGIAILFTLGKLIALMYRDGFLAAAKEAMRARGVDLGGVRLPNANLTAEQAAAFRRELGEMTNAPPMPHQ